MSSTTIYRAYKYRFYPTKSQEILIEKTFGCVRFLWNQYTAAFNDYGIVGPTQASASVKNFRDRNEFLKEVPYNALEQKRDDFEETKSQYFDKKRKTRLGRIQFKKKHIAKDSFRLSSNGFKIRNDQEIILSKIGKLRYIKDREWSGTTKSVTISKNKCNQYFVSVLVMEEVEQKQNTGRSIGIDLGLTHLLVLSDGTKIENPRWFRESQAKLKKAQQHLSRKTKGSNRYEKQRLKVAKVHLKIANQREFVLHNLSSWLVESYDHIFMEDLNVAGMKKMNLAKSVSDASWSSLVSMVKYKSDWYGRSFHRIDRFYPSSKTCSCCGHKMNKEEMNLSVREWTCPSCSIKHDRDINAAINIKNKGLSDLYCFTSDEFADYRRGEEIRPKAAMPKASSVKRLFVNTVIREITHV